MPVTTQQEQAALLERLEGTLDALERHSPRRRGKGDCSEMATSYQPG
jgi:hypothetical protein